MKETMAFQAYNNLYKIFPFSRRGLNSFTFKLGYIFRIKTCVLGTSSLLSIKEYLNLPFLK